MAQATARRWVDTEEMEWLVEELQMSFWVDFTDEEIRASTTAGLLFDGIVEKTGGFGAPRCLSSFAFFACGALWWRSRVCSGVRFVPILRCGIWWFRSSGGFGGRTLRTIAELTPWLATELPVDTLGQLVRTVVKLNQQKLAREAGGSTVNQAWSAYRELLSDSFGVPASSIHRELPLPLSRR
jgi:hypothetical protein